MAVRNSCKHHFHPRGQLFAAIIIQPPSHSPIQSFGVIFARWLYSLYSPPPPSYSFISTATFCCPHQAITFLSHPFHREGSLGREITAAAASALSKTAPNYILSLIPRPTSYYGHYKLYRLEEENLKKIISYQMVIYVNIHLTTISQYLKLLYYLKHVGGGGGRSVCHACLCQREKKQKPVRPSSRWTDRRATTRRSVPTVRPTQQPPPRPAAAPQQQ